MKKKNWKGKVLKVQLEKCKGICRVYSDEALRFAKLLNENDKVEYVDTATSIDNSIESTEDEMEEFANDESESEYIFENSDTGYLSRSELDGLSAEECRIARNELYARHGRLFDDEELQEYFNSCSWYVGTISAKDFSEDILNEYEIANRDLIVKYEKEMGYR